MAAVKERIKHLGNFWVSSNVLVAFDFSKQDFWFGLRVVKGKKDKYEIGIPFLICTAYRYRGPKTCL